MIHFVIGGAGCGKSTALMQTARKYARTGAKIRTVVPESFAFTYDKRLYHVLGAKVFNAVSACSFRTLTAEILEQEAAVRTDPADEVCRTVTLFQVIRKLSKEHCLLYYRTQAEKPYFLSEMTVQITELLQSGTAPDMLLEAAAQTQGALREKVFDIVRIYTDYLNALESRSLRDRNGDTVRAAAAADCSGFFSDEIILLDEFESFTGDQLQLMRVMLRDAKEFWIALRSDDLSAPDYSRFDAVNQTAGCIRAIAGELGIPHETIRCETPFRFSAPSLAHLSRYLFAQNQLPYTEDPAVTIVRARDTTLEAEYCAAQIRQLLMSGKYRAGDIQVVMHDLSDYGALLEAAFHRYDIPFFMDRRQSVLHTAVMQLPLILLELMQKTTTDTMLRLLKTQLSPLTPSEAADFENYIFTWDIEGKQWDKPFYPLTDPDGKYEALRQKLMQPVHSLQRIVRGGKKRSKPLCTGASLVEALYKCLQEMDVPTQIGGFASHLKDLGDIEGGRALRRLWNRLTELLDILHSTLCETEMPPRTLSDLLTAVLRSNQIPLAPQMLDAVTVQNAAAARYDDEKIVFVLGVNEGLFPASIRQSGFFTESERAWLEIRGVSLSRSVRDLCADERLIVYKTLSAPAERLWLSYALADESGSRRTPSALLGEVRRILPQVHEENADDMGISFYVSTTAAAYYSYVQDYCVSPAERETVQALLNGMPKEHARLTKLSAHYAPERLHIRNTANLRKLLGNPLTVSATQIEHAMQCPFMGFCADGLRLYIRQRRELDPLSTGNLVHLCMERIFQEYPQRSDFLALTAQELAAHIDKCTSEFLQNELGGEADKPERFLQTIERVKTRMTALLQHTQAEMQQSRFTPDACEVVIGRKNGQNGLQPYQLTLKNGVQLILNGQIDRVDLCEHNGAQYLRIVDYKTGQKEFSLADIYYGLNLQMLLYLFAISDDANAYPDTQPAGVLYMPAGAPVPGRSRSDEQSLDDYIDAYFRMSGTVLCDRGILSSMEEQIAGVYIPAKLDENDPHTGTPVLTKDSSVFTPHQLANLRQYVDQTVSEYAENLLEGNVAPCPVRARGTDVCESCAYPSLCGMDRRDRSTAKKQLSEGAAADAMRNIMENGIPDSEEGA